MKGFRSPGSAQRFLSAFSGISPHFRVCRDLRTAAELVQVADVAELPAHLLADPCGEREDLGGVLVDQVFGADVDNDPGAVQ